jgi:endoglucanase Acf2
VKLARILLISQDVNDLCSENGGRDQVEEGIQNLKRSVAIWINGTAETPFVYDNAWGGVVSCGCYMEGTDCINIYPDCPAFSD